MLEKNYDPSAIETRIYEEWERSGAFRAGNRPDAKPYCIVIPPPNVTGSLHMGHALNNTLQDVLVRYERLRGRDVLWQPGTDHAGIATQMVVERKLAQEGNQSRRELGRQEFLKRVWAWKEESGGTIARQLRRLGASCDWSRERFTMDEGLSKAVARVFVALYKEGLIYKDKRLVNWDPKFQSAISDLEVVSREVKGHLWHIKYPLADGSTYKFPIAFDEDGKPTEWEERNYIVVATTRPETMLGDTGVAVHPEDERYRALVGKKVKQPLTGRELPIIADEYSDPAKGSGAVKITPAHDFNDFEVGKRHGLQQINIFTGLGTLLHIVAVPEKYRGLDRFVARKMIVEDLEAQGFLEKTEDIVHQVPFGDRSNEVVEPYLTEQWYVRADVLAKPAREAVARGDTVIVPKSWEKTYFNWLDNIQPWCISRQLWWGHQIPAWYGPKIEEHGALRPVGTTAYGQAASTEHLRVFVAESEEHAIAEAKRYYGAEVRIEKNRLDAALLWTDQRVVGLFRDEDVLDTWFSSALWPFSTLGWPEETPELKRFYPTNTLVTAFDIIFFWVARMMMMGLHFMKDDKGRPLVPFHTVYIHAIVRDATGAKMSKSKGNVIDPLGLIDEYGADALRFTLAAMAAQGRDIKLSPARVEGYRNFATKLWNAARFAEMNECRAAPDFDPARVKETLNKWILAEVAAAERAVAQGIETFRFNEAAGALYHFVWGVFCDWYLEFAKPLLTGADEAAKAETRATTAWVLDQVLVLLHPFMPFITEELWGRTGARATSLVLAEWPKFKALSDPAAEAEMRWVVELIGRVRSVRAEMRVPAGAQIPLQVMGASPETRARLVRHRDLIVRLARLKDISEVKAAQQGTLQIVLGEAAFLLPVAEFIDVAAEASRLEKEVAKASAEIEKIDRKLASADFVAKAPEEVVEENRERRADAEALVKRLSAALAALASA
jgi:valyl-tRNA synthetase